MSPHLSPESTKICPSLFSSHGLPPLHLIPHQPCRLFLAWWPFADFLPPSMAPCAPVGSVESGTHVVTVLESETLLLGEPHEKSAGFGTWVWDFS